MVRSCDPTSLLLKHQERVDDLGVAWLCEVPEDSSPLENCCGVFGVPSKDGLNKRDNGEDEAYDARLVVYVSRALQLWMLGAPGEIGVVYEGRVERSRRHHKLPRPRITA